MTVAAGAAVKPISRDFRGGERGVQVDADRVGPEPVLSSGRRVEPVGVTLIQVIDVRDVAQQGEPDDEGEEGAADPEVRLALQAAPDQLGAGEGPLATADG